MESRDKAGHLLIGIHFLPSKSRCARMYGSLPQHWLTDETIALIDWLQSLKASL